MPKNGETVKKFAPFIIASLTLLQLFSASVFSSAPAVQWKKTYGGEKDDVACFNIQTLDGGYVLAGLTESFGAGYINIWLANVNISTELSDTVYVGELPRANPVIVEVIAPTEVLAPNVEYSVKVTVKNTGESGDCGIGMKVMGYPISVTGGGYYPINSGETKTITLTIKNLGLYGVNTPVTVYVIVGNYWSITDQKALTLTLGAGAPGTQVTSLNVEVTDVGGTKLNNMKVTVYDKMGVAFAPKTAYTVDGIASFDLGYFTGTVVVVAEDPFGVYKKVTEEKTVASGANSLHITMRTTSVESPWTFLLPYVPYIVGTAIAVGGIGGAVYYYKRKKGRGVCANFDNIEDFSFKKI